MPSSPPRRALIAVTSAQAPLHGKNITGLFINEALHPFNVFRNAGFEVDLASETGKYYVDWLSEQPSFLSGNDVTEWNDLNSPFRKKLDNMPKAADLDSSKVSSVNEC
jgi:D-lactate dehydratase